MAITNPIDVIRQLFDERIAQTDEDILRELAALPPLDEDSPQSDAAWAQIHLFLALAEQVAVRRLPAGVSLLLERACYGDPGETMRGLRHSLEAVFSPNWPALADVCLIAAGSPRRGTRLWAIDQLVILDDPRAEPIFRAALSDESEEIQWRAEIGLERLAERA